MERENEKGEGKNENFRNKNRKIMASKIWKENIDEIYNCWMQDEEVSRYM